MLGTSMKFMAAMHTGPCKPETHFFLFMHRLPDTSQSALVYTGL